jgi:hypothetical protein
MALPRQVELSISYDGTVQETVTETTTSGNSAATYTVVAGDTLWAIAKKYLGSGTQYTTIYDANADVIESTAKAHGKSSSSNGHWIWPGEVLSIPGAGEAQTTTTTSVRTSGTSNPALGSKISKAAESFTYTDVASGQSDSVSISLHDIGKEWMGSLKPKRGSSLGAKLNLTNWNGENQSNTFDCGTFVLDDIGFSGRPLSCVLGGVSVPAMDDFKSLPRTKTFEKTTIRDIASQIASSAGVSIYYDADDVQISEIEQNRQTDSAFLYSLCETYGLAMKVYNHKIVIFDIVKYEEKSPVLTIYETQMLSWSYNTTVEGTYTGVNLDYTDPDTEDTINVTMGESGRMYSINSQASSRYDAELQAAAKVNDANRSIETMEVTIRANPNLVASQCITISGLESLDGKYYVDKVKHSAGNGGYKMQLTLHKVQTPIKVTAPAPSASTGSTYTVVSGDTLWGIAKKFYGTGTKYGLIYNANADLIESTAKSHGKSSSDNGHWIWAGETFTIPEG